MAIRKRGKVYWVDFSFDRIRIRKRSPDNTYKGAQAYELLLRQRLSRGEPLHTSSAKIDAYTFKELALKWLALYVKSNNKPSEYMNRKTILNGNLIPYFGRKPIGEIDSELIEKYKQYLLEQRKLSPKSVNNYLCILSRCLKSAEEWNILKEVPRFKLLKVPPQKYDFLTEQETDVLLQNSNGTWYDMILLAVKTGLRFGELIALKWSDIQFEHKLLTVHSNIVRGIEGSPKNNRTRIIPLTGNIIEMLQNKEQDNLYVFHDEQGKPFRYNVCRFKLREICVLSGMRIITWHVLRHTFATQLSAKNISIVVIQELMGHSDIKTTRRYTHPNLTVLQNAINVLEPVFQENVTIASQIKS